MKFKLLAGISAFQVGWLLAAAAQEVAGPILDARTEVIPVKYASASELAALLNSPGTSKEATETTRLIERLERTTGAADLKAEIHGLGQRQIRSDERSNLLLVSASPAVLAKIRGIVARLDVTLAQVLVEAVVLEFPADQAWNVGRSRVADAFPSFNVLTNAATVASAWYISNRTTNTPVGPENLLAYEATLGGNLDSVMWALAGTKGVKALQRPRVQTSVGVPATIFLGMRPSPYPYYGGTSCGCPAAIQMLHTGVTLEATCFLTTDGTVLMNIRQQIDMLAGSVTIQNVGEVPVTTNYTSQAHVVVRDREIIMLGGFIEVLKEPVFSQVSALDRVPLAGSFLNRMITYPTRKTRHELVVLIRPTVLPVTGSRDL